MYEVLSTDVRTGEETQEGLSYVRSAAEDFAITLAQDAAYDGHTGRTTIRLDDGYAYFSVEARGNMTIVHDDNLGDMPTYYVGGLRKEDRIERRYRRCRAVRN